MANKENAESELQRLRREVQQLRSKVFTLSLMPHVDSYLIESGPDPTEGLRLEKRRRDQLDRDLYDLRGAS